jgi:hypothetical protein
MAARSTDQLGNTSEFSHDADMDGLYDNWESGVGIDGNGDGVGDFTLLLAKPLHRDLYVEADAMVGRAPDPAALPKVVAAFAAAPNHLVNNPDGLDGVSLHVDLDETNLPLENFFFAFTEFFFVKNAHFGAPSERSNPEIIAAKLKAYRYAIFANSHSGGSSSGMGELGGNDFMITLGNVGGGTADQQAGTFMHELGHTLGLTHGGESNHTNYKPNYYSNMNYLWQLPDALYNPTGLLDYSRSRLPDLNESSLNETVGIGGPPIPADLRVPAGLPDEWRLVKMNGAVDWSIGDQDSDGTVDNDVGVMANINRSEFPEPALSVLAGAEDWSRLMYAFRQNLYCSPGETYEPAP